MRLKPTRIEDVPVPELSGLALSGTRLLAIGDRKTVLAHAVLTDEPLEWTLVDLERDWLADAQFEGIATAADGTVLVLREDPPRVHALDLDGSTDEADALQAQAAWSVDGLDDISDISISGGQLYCLSDRSRRIVVVDLPLDPDAERARSRDECDLDVPECDDEPDGKPEGLVVTDDGALIVGLDTKSPMANLCWYQRP